MSIRTIVEFNHDFAGRFSDFRSAFHETLVRALMSNNPDEWEILRGVFGVRKITQRHHSDDGKVVIGSSEYPLP